MQKQVYTTLKTLSVLFLLFSLSDLAFAKKNFSIIVKDSNTNVGISGVRVKATHVSSNKSSFKTTNKTGQVFYTDLANGLYEFEISKENFFTYKKKLNITDKTESVMTILLKTSRPSNSKVGLKIPFKNGNGVLGGSSGKRMGSGSRTTGLSGGSGVASVGAPGAARGSSWGTGGSGYGAGAGGRGGMGAGRGRPGNLGGGLKSRGGKVKQSGTKPVVLKKASPKASGRNLSKLGIGSKVFNKEAFRKRRIKPIVTPRQRAQSGLLTAGDWNDNINFERYRTYVQNFKNNPFTKNKTLVINKVIKNIPRNVRELDLVFLLDTTGSMGDELDFIKKEVNQIVANTKAKRQINIRTGAVLYRDVGDAYTVKDIPFQTAIDVFLARLSTEYAAGGGDQPEAMYEGLNRVNGMDFRPNAQKVVFFFTDAPSKTGSEQLVYDEIQKARSKGIAFYPVASSGVDPMTEFQLRFSAQQTAGRYLFLTDDSGVGNSHAEPTIPCYNVRRLKKLMEDVIDYELTGVYKVPQEKDIIRSVGTPVGNKCHVRNQTMCLSNKNCFEVYSKNSPHFAVKPKAKRYQMKVDTPRIFGRLNAASIINKTNAQKYALEQCYNNSAFSGKYSVEYTVSNYGQVQNARVFQAGSTKKNSPLKTAYAACFQSVFQNKIKMDAPTDKQFVRVKQPISFSVTAH